MGSTPLRIAARLAITLVIAGCTPSTGTSAPSPATIATPAPPTPSAPAAASALPTDEPSATPDVPAASAPGGAIWARIEVAGDRPAPREDHTWTIAEDGRAYLFGGRDGATVFDDLWSFDFETERWERERIGGPAPRGRFGHEAVWLDGDGLLVWAGQAGSDFFDDVWLLNPSQGVWQRLESRGDIPVARYGSCSAIGTAGRLWISHGFTANGVRFDDTRRFNDDTRSWVDETPAFDRPVKRCLHACWWTSDGRLALYGGQTNGEPALGDLWFLTPGTSGAATNEWAKAPGQDAPARQLAAVARRDGVTVVFGGRASDGMPLGDTWLLPDGATKLERLDAVGPPPARSGAAMVYDPARDRMVLFGGLGENAFDDAWELELR